MVLLRIHKFTKKSKKSLSDERLVFRKVLLNFASDKLIQTVNGQR